MFGYKLSFEITEEKLKLLDELTEKLGYESRAETLNAALTLMKWKGKKTSEGYDVGAMSKDEFVKVKLF